jgi:hypothetical protein
MIYLVMGNDGDKITDLPNNQRLQTRSFICGSRCPNKRSARPDNYAHKV